MVSLFLGAFLKKGRLKYSGGLCLFFGRVDLDGFVRPLDQLGDVAPLKLFKAAECRRALGKAVIDQVVKFLFVINGRLKNVWFAAYDSAECAGSVFELWI